MYKPKLGITVGDVNGISCEVIMKTFSDSRILNQCTPIIYGSANLFSQHKQILDIADFQFVTIKSAEKAQEGKINLINSWSDKLQVELGKTTEQAGRLAHISLDHCLDDVKEGVIDAMVTAPINKKSMQMAEFPFPGHTEYLENECEGKALMMLCYKSLRVALVTSHIPLSDVSEAINKEKVKKTIERLHESLVIDFDIARPNIAVLGLNPHAGDEGVIGEEEKNVIGPAVTEMKNKGLFVHGPFAADGFFGTGNHKKYDAIVAMYHDQGLVVFKSLAFGNGVNFTAGLNVVRTSPDHGTGFDIAGKNKADHSSFRTALFTAIDIQRNRFEYHDFRKNKLIPQPRPDKKDRKRGQR